jgi:hypothetical protein
MTLLLALILAVVFCVATFFLLLDQIEGRRFNLSSTGELGFKILKEHYGNWVLGESCFENRALVN